ncbi:MAG: hypothetical protein ACK53W_06130 [Gemmatimonadota bacterium]
MARGATELVMNPTAEGQAARPRIRQLTEPAGVVLPQLVALPERA